VVFVGVGDGAVEHREFNILRYGAVGDGVAKDTEAIQRTIDVCAQNGGGTVRVPAGTYLTGTIQLRSHINLHLEEGAVLLGSTERSDYRAELGSPNRQHDGTEIPDWSSNAGREHLIVARNEKDVAITGHGTINGQGKVFFGYDGSGREGVAFGPKGWRPFRMIAFVECRDVKVQDVSLIDASGFSLWPLGCDTVAIRGITIRSHGPNTDGIDIDCCQNVRISDCSVTTGDDAIALKSGTSRFVGRVVACD
jgi:polygalacturonase